MGDEGSGDGWWAWSATADAGSEGRPSIMASSTCTVTSIVGGVEGVLLVPWVICSVVWSGDSVNTPFNGTSP